MKDWKKHLLFFSFVIAVAAVMALLEIQIEGAGGWASNLPTWKVNISFPIMGFWGNVEKPLTGYHLYLWMFSFLLPHFAFCYTKWSIKKEIYLWAFYIFFTTAEGLLWFGLNPAWGWAKFHYGIAWYKELWLLGIPAEYWLRFAVGIVLYLWANKNADTKGKAKRLP